jgi:hypothetical protein
VPNRRATPAGTGRSKKNQMCAPLPDRERSSVTGTFKSRQVKRNADASSFHVFCQNRPRGTNTFRPAAADIRQEFVFRLGGHELHRPLVEDSCESPYRHVFDPPASPCYRRASHVPFAASSRSGRPDCPISARTRPLDFSAVLSLSLFGVGSAGRCVCFATASEAIP